MRRLPRSIWPSVVLSLGGCTTFSWSDPNTGVEVRYSSTKAVDASGLLAEVQDGDKVIHIEVGKIVTQTEIDGIVRAAIEAALKVYGIP